MTCRLAPLLFALVAGCDCSGGGGRCDTSAECSGGQVCVDNACRDRDRVDASIDAGTDDGAAPDAPRADTGPPTGAGCSSDLRDVLALDGSVLFSCELDEGCRDGQCIPACEAAAASRGTVACEFMVTSPPSYPPALPPCLAAFVANAWDGPARLTVSRGAASLDATAFARIVDNTRTADLWDPVPATGLPAGQVAVLFLSSDPDAIMPENGVDLSCPITPAVDASTVVPPPGGLGDAFRIASDVPVRAYDILPYGGARSHFPSAQLLIPSSAWGTEYVVIAPPPGTHSAPGPLWIHVLALEDATTVRLRPSVDFPAVGPLPAIAAGAEGIVSLARGQYLHWEIGASDPSGTLVSADHPIAVVSGSRFLRLQPTPAPGGEAAHQQILPVDALASTHVAIPYDTRRMDLAPEEIPYRIVGAFDGTTLTFEPAIAGAPASIGRGEVVDVRSTEAFVVRSQDAMHPFAMAQLMTTANVSGGSRPGAIAPGYGPWLGDEEFVVLYPPSQFLSEYVFFSDPAYPTTSLVVTRTRGPGGAFSDVDIGCLGPISGWRALGTDYEWTTVDLIRAGVPVGSCANGRQVATSIAPFGILVWGLDSYSSYAYPAGGNARQLADLPPIF